MKTTHLSLPSPCPACGKHLDAASSFGHDNTPSPGDISVCGDCGEILEFNEDLTLRACTNEDALNDPHILKARDMVLFMKMHPKRDVE